MVPTFLGEDPGDDDTTMEASELMVVIADDWRKGALRGDKGSMARSVLPMREAKGPTGWGEELSPPG